MFLEAVRDALIFTAVFFGIPMAITAAYWRKVRK